MRIDACAILYLEAACWQRKAVCTYMLLHTISSHKFKKHSVCQSGLLHLPCKISCAIHHGGSFHSGSRRGSSLQPPLAYALVVINPCALHNGESFHSGSRWGSFLQPPLARALVMTHFCGCKAIRHQSAYSFHLFLFHSEQSKQRKLHFTSVPILLTISKSHIVASISTTWLPSLGNFRDLRLKIFSPSTGNAILPYIPPPFCVNEAQSSVFMFSPPWYLLFQWSFTVFLEDMHHKWG